MKKSKSLLLPLIGAIILLASCGIPANQSASIQTEQEKVQQNVKKLATEDPIPDLSHSLERKNIIKRLTTFEDENKVSYIYLISFGKVMAFYPVKGKVTSGSKRLTNDQQIAEGYAGAGQYGSSHPKSDIINAPELDGTYGKSGDYIFFWTTDGTYIQWNEAYMLCDKPLKMVTQPELVYEISKK